MNLYYEAVPKDPIKNLEFRQFVLGRAHTNRALQRALWEACKHDILFWTNLFLWTNDPREPNSYIPFITYPFQDEAILKILWCIRNRKALVMQKSRDMGASWMSVLAMDHQATFESAKRFVMMSYTADLVDKKGSPKSLFWKLDFIHRWVPPYLRPTVESRLLGREYISSDSTVDGVSTTERSTLGDRATAVFVDELSKYDALDADAILSNLPDVSRCRIYNFTRSVLGQAHPSSVLIEQADKGAIESLRMHWTVHPLKSEGLYRVDKRTLEVEVIDQTVRQVEVLLDDGSKKRQMYEFPTNYPFQRDGVFEWHSPWFDNERIERGNDRYVKEQLEIEDDGTAYNVFGIEIMKAYIAEHCRPAWVEGDLAFTTDGMPLHFEKKERGPIKIWAKMDGSGRLAKGPYVSGADISLGMGATNSCFSAARSDTGEKILEFCTPFMKPDDFAVKCVALCRWLHDALLCWERQGPGETFGVEVVRLRYPHIYLMKDDSKLGNPSSKKFGWFPSRGSKRTLLDSYCSGLSKRDFYNPSILAMNETLEWVEDPKKGPIHKANLAKSLDPSGAAENHGDRVIADALCYKMVVEKGGGAVQAEEPKAVPGTIAYLFEQEESNRSRGVLYPNWQGR